MHSRLRQRLYQANPLGISGSSWERVGASGNLWAIAVPNGQLCYILTFWTGIQKIIYEANALAIVVPDGHERLFIVFTWSYYMFMMRNGDYHFYIRGSREGPSSDLSWWRAGAEVCLACTLNCGRGCIWPTPSFRWGLVLCSCERHDISAFTSKGSSIESNKVWLYSVANQLS